MLISRRNALVLAGAAVGAHVLGSLPRVHAAGEKRYRIGACDWSLGRQDVGAIEVAGQAGLEGVQVSFGAPGGDSDLRKADAREKYAEACRKERIEIASLAMACLNDVPYATDDRAEQWVGECVETMAQMKQSVVLLAFFSAGDIAGKRDLQDKVVERLKKVAPRAQKAGVALGIESWMSAEEHLRMIEAVGSPAVKVYYDVCNSNDRGYDIYKELRQLGKDRICQVHCKENGALLGKGKVNFPKVKEALDEIGWGGWLIIEGATVPGKTLVECYKQNRDYLAGVFSK